METRVNKNEEERIWLNLLLLSVVIFHITKRVLLKRSCLFDCCRDISCQFYFFNIRGFVTSVLILLVLRNYYQVNLLNWKFIIAFAAGVLGFRYFDPLIPTTIANACVFNQIVFPLLIILAGVGLYSWISKDK